MTVLLNDIIQSVELWLKLTKKTQPYVNPNLDPVLLVPGIAGSILNSVDDDGKEERIWVRILRADHEFRMKLWSRFDPNTGRTVSLDPKSNIVVPEDRFGLYAIDVLDPDLVSKKCRFFASYEKNDLGLTDETSDGGKDLGPKTLSSSLTVVKDAKKSEPWWLFVMLDVLHHRSRSYTNLKIVGRDCVCYFHDMIVEMLKWGFQEGKTLFGFGYDFRQSNRLQETMDCFAAKLESVFTASGGRKINIITHSMGGLLVKCFMGLHGDIFEKYVNTWIAIAAPFRGKRLGVISYIVFNLALFARLMFNNSYCIKIGAPGYITTTLLNGMSFVNGWEQNLFISKWSMQQLLIECPSIYELLACPNFDWPTTPLLEVWREKRDTDGNSRTILESYKPAETASILNDALSNNTVSYDGVDAIVPFNLDILKWADETQKLLSCAKVPSQVKFYNIYGTSCDTPHSVCYGREETPITDLQQLPLFQPKYFCVDGDGTVPVESAKADGLIAEARVGVPGDHRGIICDRHVFRILKHWLKAGDQDPFYNPLNDFVILPTAFEIEKFKEDGLLVSSVKEEWEIISDDLGQQTEKEPSVTSLSVSKVGKDSSSREEACATVIVHPQSEGKQHVELRAVSISTGD
ncbi:hypothetical protein GIB67_043243 [Kingdonia uniflora]|uniref:Uncharacterized protein n=1 Tax=Kingdonia uniflora TaxID=39325 RepID=A0A7J7L2T3_9MAGN|nr:hypothetical protein GIB67_043243 [Kingdonia uniflora]